MTNTNEMIVIKDLHKHFGDVQALNGVSLTVERGKVVVVIGPSGSGKSTMLRCINHLERPTSGEVIIEGELLTGDQKQLNRIRTEIGMVFQLFNLFPHLTALENITLAPMCRSTGPNDPIPTARIGSPESPKKPMFIQDNSPVGNSNAWRLPAPLP